MQNRDEFIVHLLCRECGAEEWVDATDTETEPCSCGAEVDVDDQDLCGLEPIRREVTREYAREIAEYVSSRFPGDAEALAVYQDLFDAAVDFHPATFDSDDFEDRYRGRHESFDMFLRQYAEGSGMFAGARPEVVEYFNWEKYGENQRQYYTVDDRYGYVYVFTE